MIPSAALPVKTVLGNYEIRSVLGQGGGGISYLAFDRSLEREVVIKEHFPVGLCRREVNSAEIRPEDEEVYTRSLHIFCKEARILAGLNYPNVVKVHDIFEGTGTAYLVMEYIEGQTLKNYLPQHAENIKDTQYILEQLLHTLHYLHGNSIVHRDIKPSNIIIRENGQPVIIDFGSAHLGTIDHTLTPVGSPGFAAPEQFSPGGRVGAWSDLFALANCFLHLIPEKKKKHYPQSFLKTLQKAASPEIAARYSGADAWLCELAPSGRKGRARMLSMSTILLFVTVSALCGLSLYLLVHQQTDTNEEKEKSSVAAPPTMSQIIEKKRVLKPLPEPPATNGPPKIPMGTLFYPVENPPSIPEEALFNSDRTGVQDAATIRQFQTLQTEYRRKYKDYCKYAMQNSIPMTTQEEYLQQLTEAYRSNLLILAE